MTNVFDLTPEHVGIYRAQCTQLCGLYHSLMFFHVVALPPSQFPNMMDYLQTLFGFFNAPLFATFILGMFWKRMTSTAGWAGLVSGTLSAVFVFILSKAGVISLPGQGTPFIAASAAFVVDIIVSVAVTMVTTPKPATN